MEVKFAKLHPKAVIPSYAKPGDNGLDLVAIDYFEGKDYHEYRFGLAVEIPDGYVGLLFPRSSAYKKTLILPNSVGVIDSSYRGELIARFKTTVTIPFEFKAYEVGDRVVQLVIVPCPQINVVEVPYEALSITERGSGGFGSTGQ